MEALTPLAQSSSQRSWSGGRVARARSAAARSCRKRWTRSGNHGRAEDFRELTCGVTAECLHLPEAVLGGDVTLGDDEVVERCGADVWDAMGVALDGDRSGEAGDRRWCRRRAAGQMPAWRVEPRSGPRRRWPRSGGSRWGRGRRGLWGRMEGRVTCDSSCGSSGVSLESRRESGDFGRRGVIGMQSLIREGYGGGSVAVRDNRWVRGPNGRIE